ncbi:MAG: hypothetical protein DELT_00607 [Desulfovibrio sp.]
MKTFLFSDSQILAILKQAEDGVPVTELCREHGMSSATFYKWRVKVLRQATARASAIKNILYAQGLGIFTIRKIENGSRFTVRHVSFVVTLNYRHEQTTEDRTRSFHAALVSSVANDEQLLCVDRYFCVQGKGYTVGFVLEAYKVQASRIGYVEDGQPKVHYLDRMGVDFAFRQFFPFEDSAEWRLCWQRMNVSEFIEQYPNPADRFIASIKIERRLKKSKARMEVAQYIDHKE